MEKIENIITDKEVQSIKKIDWTSMDDIRQRRKEYYQNNKDYIREYQRQYRSSQKSKELRSIANKKQYEKNKLNDMDKWEDEKLKQKRKPGRPTVKTDEDLKRTRKEYYEKRKEELKAKEREYYHKYREERLLKKQTDPKFKANQLKYREKNQEKLKEKSLKYYNENKEQERMKRNKTYYDRKQRIKELEALLNEKNTIVDRQVKDITIEPKSKNISFKIDNVEINIKIE